MPKQYSIAEARNRFAALVHAVEQESAIELTRRGKPVAMLLSIQEYKRLAHDKPGYWEALQTFQEKVNLQELDIEPGLFTDLRDRSPGREMIW